MTHTEMFNNYIVKENVIISKLLFTSLNNDWFFSLGIENIVSQKKYMDISALEDFYVLFAVWQLYNADQDHNLIVKFSILIARHNFLG